MVTVTKQTSPSIIPLPITTAVTVATAVAAAAAEPIVDYAHLINKQLLRYTVSSVANLPTLREW